MHDEHWICFNGITFGGQCSRFTMGFPLEEILNLRSLKLKSYSALTMNTTMVLLQKTWAHNLKVLMCTIHDDIIMCAFAYMRFGWLSSQIIIFKNAMCQHSPITKKFSNIVEVNIWEQPIECFGTILRTFSFLKIIGNPKPYM